MDLESHAKRIALAKLCQGDPGGRVLGPRLGTGGPFTGVFLWDTAFTALWARYFRDELPVEQSLDNLYRLQNEDGFISREFAADGTAVWPGNHPMSFAPPVLTWAELELFDLTGDTGRIRRVFPSLQRHHAYCSTRFRRDDGLYIGDPWGAGMDNLPRWPHGFTGSNDCLRMREEDLHPAAVNWYRGWVCTSPGGTWNQQGRYIDMSAQMAFDALNLARMAALLGDAASKVRYTAEHAALADTINERCWDNERKFYVDLGHGKQIPRLHVGGFWALIARIVPQDRIDGVLSHLTNPDTFDRPVPVPSLAANDPDYVPGGDYWRGASWPPTTYMVLRGLRAVGAGDLARSIAEKYHDALSVVFGKTNTFWENLAPESPVPGNPAAPDFCGWAGLGPVAVAREFLYTNHP